MTKYLVLFSYSEDAVANMLEHPSDRASAVTKLCEAAGGRLESFHWMLGPYDGVLIAEVPDGRAMASIAMAVTGAHALKKFETYELLRHEDIAEIERIARQVAQSYAPPGRES
jgi:uncharacterized protein with GYD domain